MSLANEGPVDRVIRTLVGLGITSLFFVGPHSPWALLGIIPLVTGVVGFCPFYRLLHLTTKRAQSV
jgi:DUF2892 family protein